MVLSGKTTSHGPGSSTAPRPANGHAVQELLFRFTDKLYRAKYLNDIYNAALDAICEGLGSNRASILRFDDGGKMRFVAWRGLSQNYRSAVEGHCPWRPGDGNAQPICVEDIGTSSESAAIQDAVMAENIRGLAFIPLTIDGGVVGKFMVYYTTPRLFSDQELDLALIIARQLGFALERNLDDGVAQRLVAIVDSSEDAIMSGNLDGIITSWNGGAERLFGYSAREAIGQPLAMLVPPGHDEEASGIITRIRRGVRLNSYETVGLCKDGRLADISLTVSPIRDVDGRVVGVSKIARDVTERHKAAERQTLLLREMNHRIKNLLTLSISLLRLSAKSATTPKELADKVALRLQALARAHSLTVSPSQQLLDGEEPVSTTLLSLLQAILSPFGLEEGSGGEQNGLISIAGEDMEMEAEAASPLALLVYELATNATKHGSLSKPGGRVDVRVTKDGQCPILTWAESGGPEVTEPKERGFGSTLVDLAAAQLGEVRRDWLPTGHRLQLIIRHGTKGH